MKLFKKDLVENLTTRNLDKIEKYLSYLEIYKNPDILRSVISCKPDLKIHNFSKDELKTLIYNLDNYKSKNKKHGKIRTVAEILAKLRVYITDSGENKKIKSTLSDENRSGTSTAQPAPRPSKILHSTNFAESSSSGQGEDIDVSEGDASIPPTGRILSTSFNTVDSASDSSEKGGNDQAVIEGEASRSLDSEEIRPPVNSESSELAEDFLPVTVPDDADDADDADDRDLTSKQGGAVFVATDSTVNNLLEAEQSSIQEVEEEESVSTQPKRVRWAVQIEEVQVIKEEESVSTEEEETGTPQRSKAGTSSVSTEEEETRKKMQEFNQAKEEAKEYVMEHLAVLQANPMAWDDPEYLKQTALKIMDSNYTEKMLAVIGINSMDEEFCKDIEKFGQTAMKLHVNIPSSRIGTDWDASMEEANEILQYSKYNGCLNAEYALLLLNTYIKRGRILEEELGADSDHLVEIMINIPAYVMGYNKNIVRPVKAPYQPYIAPLVAIPHLTSQEELAIEKLNHDFYQHSVPFYTKMLFDIQWQYSAPYGEDEE